MEYLGKRNVEVKLNARVINYESNELVLSEGPVIDTKNVFWVAGVKPTVCKDYLPKHTDRETA